MSNGRLCPIFITVLVSVVAACSHKTAVSPPQPGTSYLEGLRNFHLGTPEGYARAADLFRKAHALQSSSCEYSLNLVQSLLFLAMEQSLNWEEYEPRQTEAKNVLDSVGDACSVTYEPFVLRLRALIAGRGAAASGMINRAVELDPHEAMNWVVLGYLDPMSPHLVTPDGLGKWVAMTRAVELQPDSALIQYEFGKNYPSFRGKEDEARQAFERAIQRSPRHFRAYLALAYAADESMDVEHLYIKAVEIAPTFLEGLMALGSYYASLEEVEKAVAQFSAALQLNPKFVTAHFSLGSLMLQADRIDEAAPYFNRVIDLDAESFEAHYYLGNIWHQRNDLQKAQAFYEHAIAIRANYPEAEYSLGHVYRQQGEIGLAEAQFDKVIKMRPGYGDAYMSRADIFTERHQFQEALADYGKATECYEDQIRSFNTSIAYADAHPESRLQQASRKRDVRDKTRAEALLQRAQMYKSEMEETMRKHTP